MNCVDWWNSINIYLSIYFFSFLFGLVFVLYNKISFLTRVINIYISNKSCGYYRVSSHTLYSILYTSRIALCAHTQSHICLFSLLRTSRTYISLYPIKENLYKSACAWDEQHRRKSSHIEWENASVHKFPGDLLIVQW